MTTTAHAKLTTVATFPEHFFLENLAVRADGSILVTVLNHKQLWYVPAPNGGQPVTPALVHTFDHFAMGVVEAEPDIFYVSTAGQAAARQKLLRANQHAGRAEAALQRIAPPERVLQVGDNAGIRQSLDGLHVRAVALHRKQQAAAHHRVVDEHRAGAADALLTPNMGAG